MIGKYNYGTGRRKNAVARVFIKAGKGDIVVNGKPVDIFFSRETGRMIVRQPLELTNHAQTFDIKVNVFGGEAAQHLVGRIHDVPVAADLFRLGRKGLHGGVLRIRDPGCREILSRYFGRLVLGTAANPKL